MDTAVRKRTIWVWLIFLYLGLFTGVSLLGMMQVHSGMLPLSPAQKAYFESLSFFDIALTLACSVFILCGAFALFLLRRAAFYLLVIGLVLSAIDHIWDFVGRAEQSPALANGGNTLHAIVYYGIVLAACIYSYRLIKRGVLN
jgi:hypothetical protein